MTEKEETEIEQLKKHMFYDEITNVEPEEPELCPYGYSEEECTGEGCAGIETCEFCCPFNKLGV